MKRRIGIFGGSFDPVHEGHREAVRSFLKSGLIDELWVLLTPDPPHKQTQSQAAYNHRLKMLQLAFDGWSGVVISTVEQDLPFPSYTLQTLHHLKAEHPEATFFLCLGEDSVQHFHRWKSWREILKEVTILAAERPGSDLNLAEPEVLEHTIFVDHEGVDFSSTKLRSGENALAGSHLPDSVKQYIETHNLYRPV